jgi:hypothetical protein
LVTARQRERHKERDREGSEEAERLSVCWQREMEGREARRWEEEVLSLLALLVA